MKVEERWLPIRDTDESYWVSDRGRVMSKKWGKSRIIKAKRSKGNYYRVSLSMNNVVVTRAIHRLVAEAFIPNPDNLPEVNHKDENKANNCAYNLEWCTRKYNHAYGTARQRNVENTKRAVIQLSLYSEDIIAEYDSVSEAIHKFGGSICNCLSGRTKSAYGYRWRYKNACRR